jgi:uncharacterized protein YlxW (UPF0749 family)
LVFAITGWTRASTLRQEVAGLQAHVTDLEGKVTAANNELAAVSAERDGLKPLVAQVDSLSQRVATFDQERSRRRQGATMPKTRSFAWKSGSRP